MGVVERSIKLLCTILFICALGCANSCKKDPPGPSVTPPPAPQIKDPYISWLPETRIQITQQLSGPNVFFSYPRITEMQNGDLICIYESDFAVYAIFSKTKGLSWQQPVLIANHRNGIGAQAPEIIQLKNGNLIAAYNLRPQKLANGTYDPGKKFAIAIKISSDKGLTWSDEKVLYEAGSDFKNGCWEPAMTQLNDGSLLLLFSNEGVYTTTEEQNISLLKSIDNGNTWTQTPQIISFTSGKRDGMPVPVIDKQTGNLLFTIEDNAVQEFKPSIIKVPFPWDGNYVSGSSSNRIKPLRDVIPANIYAGAPYLRQFADSSFVFSVQSTLGRKPDWELSNMRIALADKNLSKFTLMKEVPFDIPADKFALWNSLCVLSDNTVIAVTSTNAYDNKNALWMIKGKLVK